MTTATILVVIWMMPAGSMGWPIPSGATFQEFNTRDKCEQVALTLRAKTKLKEIFCVTK